MTGRQDPAGSTLVPLGDPEGRTQWLVQHAGRTYAVFAHGSSASVTDAACPHRGGPLVEGEVRDGAVVCPWHRYAYDLGTGRCRTVDRHRLRVYPVVRIDGRLYAEVPERGPFAWPSLLWRRRRGGRV